MDFIMVITETTSGQNKNIYKNLSEAYTEETLKIIEIIRELKGMDLSLYANKKEQKILLLDNNKKEIIFLKRFESYKDYLIRENRGDYNEQVKK